ncbi:hypothetical protein K1W54_38170 [Micromonospora sp. CPCC 205371]|nr:hypothetical protein [Micromonospora sp. CPCC 205371]
MSTLAFIDLETTGLDPERHHIWEIGAIVRGHRDESFNGEWRIELRPHLNTADPIALRIGRFYERRSSLLRSNGRTAPEAWVHTRPPYLKGPGSAGPRFYEASRMHVAKLLAEMLDGAQMIGCVPSFDAGFLAPFLRRHWQAPTWHYHLVDVEHLALGFLAGASAVVPELPCQSDDLSRRLGVEPPGPDQRHTALGDARWAEAIYDRVMGAPA